MLRSTEPSTLLTFISIDSEVFEKCDQNEIFFIYGRPPTLEKRALSQIVAIKNMSEAYVVVPPELQNVLAYIPGGMPSRLLGRD